MKINDIITKFEESYPTSYAFDGDNVGLLVGDKNATVTKVLATCDVDLGVVEEAIEKGANFIVSHHPLMFHPVNRMTEDSPEQKTIRLMIENGISHYAAHTNLDTGAGGINDLMAQMLGMEDTKVIDVVATDERGVHGYGRICNLKEAFTVKELMDKIKSVFGAKGLKYTGNLEDKVSRLAVNTGGGAGILEECINKGCDTFITGDVKYNGYRDALDMGMKIIDIMHYDSEQISKVWFENWFKENFPDVEVIKSVANQNVVKVY